MIRRILLSLAALPLIAVPAHAQVAISGLPVATTPLSGTEVLPVVQTGTTKKATAASVSSVITGTANTWIGKQTFPATNTAAASINLPHGTAPTSPINGDLWSTTAGFFGRVNGSTVGPFSTGGGAGTVTSVAVSGGSTGLSVTGSPITSSGTITLGGTLAVANGGTGSTSASAARTALGVAIGSNVQAWSGDLDALSALSGTNTIYYRSGTNAWSPVTVGSGLSFGGGSLTATGSGGSVTSVGLSGGTTGLTASGSPVTTAGTITLGGTLAVANGGTGSTSAANARTALGLAIGTNVQGWNAGLDSLAAASGTNTIYYRSAVNTWSPVTVGSGLGFSAGSLTATGSGGSVTSVNVSPGSTGLTFTGGPITTSGTITAAGTLIPVNGGTGMNGYVTGDIVYASNSVTLDRLTDVASGNVLLSGGVGLPPLYGKIDFGTHLAPGTVLTPVHGGTGLNGYTTGSLVYSSNSVTLAELLDVATDNVLLSGGVGLPPSYGKVGLANHVSGVLSVANGGTGVSAKVGTGSVVLNQTPVISNLQLNQGASAGTQYRAIDSIGGGQFAIDQQLTNGVSTSPVVLMGAPGYANLVFVSGSDGTNRFADLILMSVAAGTVNVISSLDAAGTPAVRTYSQSGSALRLQMASGTYAVNMTALIQ